MFGNYPRKIHKRPRNYQQHRQPKEKIFFSKHRRKHFQHGVIISPRKEKEICSEPSVYKIYRRGNNR